MKTRNEIRNEGMNILIRYMGLLEAEEFITIIQQENFDYTTWQRSLWIDKSVRELSKEAMDSIQKD
ncbi:hypothetical protein JW964_04375 [candidate division KSB1 bacterium]|nr:hypothetical protein [candidate division KSB1 bacterium]